MKQKFRQPSEEEILSKLHARWTPHKGQIPVGKAIFHDKKYLTWIQCGRKWGKVIPLTSRVLTNKGWAANGDLKVGDTLFTHTGTPTKILGFSPIRNVDTYTLHFSGDTSSEASITHRWLS